MSLETEGSLMQIRTLNKAQKKNQAYTACIKRRRSWKYKD